MKEEHYSEQHVHVRKLVVVLLLLIATSMLFLAYRERTRKKPTSPIEKVHNMTQATGSMWLKLADSRHVYDIGENVEVIVHADTRGKGIIGYDTVLKVPFAKARYISHEELHSDFEVKVTQSTDAIYISGLSRDQNITPREVALAGEPVVSIILKPFVTDILPLNIAYTPDDTSDSNLITKDTHDLLGTVSGDVAYFGQEKSVRVGETVEISEGIMLSLKPLTTPNENCADCFTLAPVVVSSKGTSTSNTFEFGGITGTTHAVIEVDAGIIEATMVSLTQLRIRFAPHDR